MRQTKLIRSIAVVALPAALALVVQACTEVLERADVLVRPTVFSAVSLTNITADANQTIQGPVGLVQVLDQENQPMPGVSVTFTVSRGTLVGATTTTDASGQAAAESWNVGTVAGPATLTATLTNQPAGINLPPVVFNATINAGPAAAVVVANNSSPQTGTAGAAVATPPAVRVNDQFGNAKSGVVVTFTVLTGGGTLNSSTATTATATTLATGIAALGGWTLGTAAGTNTLRAAAAGVATPLTLTATGGPGPVNKIVIAPGSPSSQGQTAQAGTNVPVAPSVLLTDQFNNPIAATTTVRFAVSTGNGKVLANSGDATGSTSLDVTSNASGIASVFGWRLGAVGANEITVTVPSASSVTPFAITATGTAGAPASIAIVTETPSSNNQTAVVNAAVAVAPGVVVRDANGFGVPGQQVTFTVGANSGTVRATSGSTPGTSASVTTDANGVARLFDWKLGNRGANTLTAVVASNTSLTTSFSATGTAGPPASIAIVTETPSSNNQTTIANTEVPVDPGVIVRDASGLPVDAGHNISFTINTGGGVVSATQTGTGGTTATVATDANGIARLGYWKPGTVGTNANILRAAVVATPALFADFTASGTVGPPTRMFDVNLPWPFTRQTTSNGGEPKIQVVDAGGNGVSGVTINWTNAGNANSTVGGTISSITNSEGIASFLKTQGGIWTANGPLGTTMQLRATAASDPTLLVTLESTIVGAASTTAIIRDVPTTVTVNGIVTPSVLLEVRDAGGRPVPGGGFTWSYTTNPGSPGTGTLTPTIGGVDSVGQAGVEWRVSRTAGTNSVLWTLDATGISRSFSTLGVAGAAAAIAVNAGNDQSAPRSTAVPVAPSVIVRDQFGNPVVAGTSVTFSPATGSGSVTGSPATTVGATGVATVGSWTLGSTAGPQQLNATVTGSSPAITQPFNATATDPCASPTAHTVGGAPVSGTLASTDCNQVISSQTYYTDLFQIVVPPATTRLMSATLSSSTFGPELRSFIYPPSNAYWFNNNTVPASITANYVLGPGSYELAASSANATTTGAYNFSTVLNPSMPAGCGNFLVTKNITVTTHTLASSSCLYTYSGGTSQVSSRIYLLFLPASQTATVELSGATIDWYLEAWDVSGSTRTFVASKDQFSFGVTEVMTVPSATTGRFLEIRAMHYHGQSPQSGTYTFKIAQ